MYFLLLYVHIAMAGSWPDTPRGVMVPGTSLQEMGIIQDPVGNILRAVML